MELLDANLVELSDGEYVAATIMPSKDIYGNWTKKRMCREYRSINKQTISDKYAMLRLEEIFDSIGLTRCLVH